MTGIRPIDPAGARSPGRRERMPTQPMPSSTVRPTTNTSNVTPATFPYRELVGPTSSPPRAARRSRTMSMPPPAVPVHVRSAMQPAMPGTRVRPLRGPVSALTRAGQGHSGLAFPGRAVRVLPVLGRPVRVRPDTGLVVMVLEATVPGVIVPGVTARGVRIRASARPSPTPARARDRLRRSSSSSPRSSRFSRSSAISERAGSPPNPAQCPSTSAERNRPRQRRRPRTNSSSPPGPRRRSSTAS